MNWKTIGIAVASAVLVDLQAYYNALNSWKPDPENPANYRPAFRFDLLIIRASIGFLTGVVGAQLPS